ncbi:MAG TPA: nuclear transport factor 2 family protein, partial [Solirubrobacterales bacterium]|nr:nuclear transport factor 2 family protein [Solirubrobacterales bacterium]
DFDAATMILHPEVDFFRPGGLPLLHGAAAIRAWAEPHALEDQRWEPLEFRVHEGRVLVRQRVSARGATSGIELDLETWAVWTFDESGLVTSVQAFAIQDSREAFEAAGLGESMSEENVRTLRQWYAAYNEGDFDRAVSFAHPDIEIVLPGTQIPYRGIASIRKWMEPDAFAMQTFEPLEVIASENKALVKARVTARGAGSGIEMKTDAWAVWTFDEDGRVLRVEGYLEHERAKALKAAGLSE